MEELIALIVRAPDLSDGSKITAIEMLPHFKNGKLPSLNELKRLRNTARSTIQKHLDELVEYGAFKKIKTDNKRSRYKIDEEALLHKNGLQDFGQVIRWIKSFSAGESSNPNFVSTALTDTKSWMPQDALNYFLMLGNRKGFKIKKGVQKFYLFRRLISKVGGAKLQKMIEFFFNNHNRMGVEYSIDIFLKKWEHIKKSI